MGRRGRRDDGDRDGPSDRFDRRDRRRDGEHVPEHGRWGDRRRRARSRPSGGQALPDRGRRFARLAYAKHGFPASGARRSPLPGADGERWVQRCRTRVGAAGRATSAITAVRSRSGSPH